MADEVKLDSFTIKPTGNQEYTEIPDCKNIYEKQISVSFKADFNTIAVFLNTLERHRPVIFVDEFTIVRSNKDNLGHQVSMNLSIFVRKQQNS